MFFGRKSTDSSAMQGPGDEDKNAPRDPKKPPGCENPWPGIWNFGWRMAAVGL